MRFCRKRFNSLLFFVNFGGLRSGEGEGEGEARLALPPFQRWAHPAISGLEKSASQACSSISLEYNPASFLLLFRDVQTPYCSACGGLKKRFVLEKRRG